jgi:predicted ATP-grasp superfamily ATP-dependent carboligase
MGRFCALLARPKNCGFTHKRLREKLETGGTSTLRIAAPNPILEQVAHQLLSALKCHGVAMVEFKYDPEKQKGWFLEINPRLWGSLHLAISAGVDFPYLLYVAATEGPEKAIQQQASEKTRQGIIARWYLGDCLLALSKLQKSKILSAAKLFLPGGADSYDDFHWVDPMSFLGELAIYGYRFVKTGSMNPTDEGVLG